MAKQTIKPRMPVTAPAVAAASAPAAAAPATKAEVAAKPIAHSAFLTFEYVSNIGSSTNVVSVILTRSKGTLGFIRWDKTWRQYTYYPTPGTIYNGRCLSDILGQLHVMMEAWAAKKGKPLRTNDAH